jgi:SAM-dependent methyltransferase
MFPVARHIRGLGMSDWEPLVDGLADKLYFQNTFFHTTPKLDLLQLAPEYLGSYDFVIASEVFEHISPPVQPAFDGLPRLLRPNGFIVFTVPWRPSGSTQEHFPNLFDWRIVELRSGHIVVNRDKKGALEVFENPIFHGGPGQTLEMRVFTRPDLITHLQNAGLSSLQFAPIEENPRFGIIWEGDWSIGLVARKNPKEEVSSPEIKLSNHLIGDSLEKEIQEQTKPTRNRWLRIKP